MIVIGWSFGSWITIRNEDKRKQELNDGFAAVKGFVFQFFLCGEHPHQPQRTRILGALEWPTIVRVGTFEQSVGDKLLCKEISMSPVDELLRIPSVVLEHHHESGEDGVSSIVIVERGRGSIDISTTQDLHDATILFELIDGLGMRRTESTTLYGRDIELVLEDTRVKSGVV